MDAELSGALIALLVPLFFGTGMVFARVGLIHVPANTGNFVSLLAGWVVISAAAVVLYPGDLFKLTAAGVAWLAMIGIVNFPGGRLMNFTSIKLLGLLRANPLLAASPIISAVEGVVFLNEDLNMAVGTGTALVVAGVIITVSAEIRSRTRVPAVVVQGVQPDVAGGVIARHPQLAGYAAGITGAFAYGSVPVLGSIAVQDYAPPLVSAAYTMLFGFVVMGLMVGTRLPRDLSRTPWRSIVFVALSGVSMGIGVAFLYVSLSKASVVVISPVFALNPLVSLLLVHIFLQRLERVTLPLVVGTMMVVAGVVAVGVGTQL